MNVIHKKEICEEILSRAGMTPARFLNINSQQEVFLCDIINSLQYSKLKKLKSQENGIESGKSNISKLYKLSLH